MLARMWSNRNADMSLGGMYNGTATLENSLEGSYKTTHTLLPYNPAPWYLLKGVQNLGPHKNLHMDDYN